MKKVKAVSCSQQGYPMPSYYHI